jgi:signal transduction histidine kinase
MTQPNARPDAVFFFDPDGRRVAASEEADALFPDARIDGLDDLGRELRTADGAPISLQPGETSVALPARDAGRAPFQVLVERLVVEPGGLLQGPATEVRLFPLDRGDDPVLKRALGSVLAHELRTPLTTIYGGAQLLIDPAASEATRTEAARTVAREAQHLHDIVEDLVVLLRFDRIRSSDMEPLLLQRVLPAVVKLERGLRPAAEISLALPVDLPPVLANETHVQHAFRNLLSTALYYGPADGKVEVEARVVHDEVEVVVRDQGPVLDPDQARDAFELFGHSARTTGDPSGVNLGPFVSRRLIDAMGGRIWAAPGAQGMESGFSLPVAVG